MFDFKESSMLPFLKDSLFLISSYSGNKWNSMLFPGLRLQDETCMNPIQWLFSVSATLYVLDYPYCDYW